MTLIRLNSENISVQWVLTGHFHIGNNQYHSSKIGNGYKITNSALPKNY